MEQTKKTLSLKQKIVKISNELRLNKDGQNDYSKYNYFTPDSILIKLNPLLEKYDLFTCFGMRWNRDIEMYTSILEIEDSNAGGKVTYELDLHPSILAKSGKVGPQDAGSTMTYSKRYLLMNAFNIADDKADPDSNEITKKTAEKEEKKVAETTEKINAKLNDLSKAKI